MEYKNKQPIAILLSTFNGERYIEELLQSIIEQVFQSFTLYVRDDGSTDSTISIIKEFASADDRIVYIDDNLHLGPSQTFLYLLNSVDSSYYMFCDQDDVWLPEKIGISYDYIKETERQRGENIPIIAYTDLVVTDQNLNVIAPSLWEYSHMKVDAPTTFNYICVYNNIAGCASIFNKPAKNTLNTGITTLPKNIYHDWWLAICVSRSGGIIEPIRKATILFRRHGGNETVVSSSNKSLSSKIGRLKDSYLVIRKRYGFFKSIGYGPFIKYLFFKLIVSLRYN